MAGLNRQDLMRRAQAVLQRRRPIVQQRQYWWTDEAEAEVKAFRAGGPLPTSAEGLELLAIEIELDQRV